MEPVNVARAPGRRPYGHRLAWVPCVSLVLPQVLLWHFYPVAMGSPQGLCSRQHRVEGLVWEQQVTVGGGPRDPVRVAAPPREGLCLPLRCHA